MCIYLYVHMDLSIYTYMCAIYVFSYVCIYIFHGGREVLYFVLK